MPLTSVQKNAYSDKFASLSHAHRIATSTVYSTYRDTKCYHEWKKPYLHLLVWQKSAVYWMRSDAVALGQDDEGNDVFVGRLTVGDGLTLGKVIPQKKGIFVPFNDTEIKMKDFEVLVEDSTPPIRSVSWVRVTEGKIPEKAIMAGTFRRGGKYYIGRGLFQGVITPGKVHSGNGLIYFGYGDKQNTSKEYEVLVEI